MTGRRRLRTYGFAAATHVFGRLGPSTRLAGRYIWPIADPERWR